MAVVEYEELEFYNAYIYQRCKVPLNNQGLVLIRGLNLDDGGYLGAGKSSLFEVFSQMQLGKGGKRDTRKQKESKDEIVNEFVGKNFEAHLRFRVDGKPYEIIQYRKHDRYGNKIRVIDRDIGANAIPKINARSPFKWIRETLLQTDETSFFNLVYLAQEFSNVMIHGTESERKNRLTAMFNLNVYDELLKLTRRALSTHAGAIEDMERLRGELQALEADIDASPLLVDLEKDLSEKQDKLEKLETAVSDKMEEFTALTEKHTKVKRRQEYIREIRKRFREGKFVDLSDPREIDSELAKELKRSYDNINAELITIRKKLDSIGQRRIIETQLAQISGRDTEEIHEELAEVKAAIRRLANVELPAAEERAEIIADLDRIAVPGLPMEALESERQDAISREADLKTKVEQLSSQLHDSVCPTCKRPYDLSVTKIKKLQEELEKKRKDLTEVSSYVHKLNRQVKSVLSYKELTARLDAITTDRGPDDVQEELNKKLKKEKELSSELERAQTKSDLEAKLQKLPTEREVDLRKKARNLQRQVGTLRIQSNNSAKIVELLGKLKGLPKGDVDSLQGKLDRIKSLLDRASSALSAASSKVTVASKAVDDLRLKQRRVKRLRKTIQKRESIVQEMRCLEALKAAFSPKGLKLDRFRSILTDAAERTVPLYSNILWTNRNVKLTIAEVENALNFQMDRQGGSSTNSSLLSGGERHKAGLALLFGMRDLKETYTNTSTNLLIVDEPFGGLDPQGTERLISLFEMLKPKFSSIFVVSHRPEVLQHPVWDQTWWAIRENNNATLYTEPPPSRYLVAASELVKQ